MQGSIQPFFIVRPSIEGHQIGVVLMKTKLAFWATVVARWAWCGTCVALSLAGALSWVAAMGYADLPWLATRDARGALATFVGGLALLAIVGAHTAFNRWLATRTRCKGGLSWLALSPRVQLCYSRRHWQLTVKRKVVKVAAKAPGEVASSHLAESGPVATYGREVALRARALGLRDIAARRYVDAASLLRFGPLKRPTAD
jgi:hypothetical protein